MVGEGEFGKVNEFKNLVTILCKHGSMEREIRERTVKVYVDTGDGSAGECYEEKENKHGCKKDNKE